MSEQQPKTIYLKDYQPPEYLIDTVELYFWLGEEETRVSSTLCCRKNPAGSKQELLPLVLDGEAELVSVSLDGRILGSGEYSASEGLLTVHTVPEDFEIKVETRLEPEKNTSLEGLYRSSGNFCTQCEAEGFRNITYYPDRPDVMAQFTTTIEADLSIPVLLSNGNLVKSGTLDNSRHFATWNDPFPKPCYLFALVAGNLVRIEDIHRTRSGHDVDLHIYVQEHNSNRCFHAMESLKKAMKWDEEVFGLEYDLDLYMIVAVDDFNMGAMENKGLNVFNSKYVLAKPETATDIDYARIEAVIAHEYFHNWTGNRVTCRDWFQLSLKEGLTVFRDQEFSADMTSRPVKRIQDVSMLRNAQFPEDSGPMAHSVRPESYIEINNFYTVTVYEKGAEVIRMIHTLLGPVGFRMGMDLYFDRHDGHAVTCEDFVQAMEDANKKDLGQFRLWYSQAGTPKLAVTGRYDEEALSFSLTISQSCPLTPGQSVKKSMHIPLALGLLGQDGQEIPLKLRDGTEALSQSMLDITDQEQTFVFEEVSSRPIPSLLRSFSAPVQLDYAYSDEELILLLAHDTDSFNRWEACQRLTTRLLINLVQAESRGETGEIPEDFILLFKDLLCSADREDASFLSLLLTLPSEKYIGEQMNVIDVDGIHRARRHLRTTLASNLRSYFLTLYNKNVTKEAYRYDPALAGRRELKNTCLAYLMLLDDRSVKDLCLGQFRQSDNMTDVQAAFRAMVHNPDCPERQDVIASFYKTWKEDSLVLDSWFALQATAPLPGTLKDVKSLLNHPAFSITNPNKVRSLIGTFCAMNHICFHDKSGDGYSFLADQVLRLDAMNPQIASRLVAPLSRWQRFDINRQKMMTREIERILSRKDLSRDVYEIASKSLVEM